ncbi:hypothetical protein L596_008600 [Steinernema carpocapsae]|uniref:Uncharacterized protein n=1 Tax=Steinernema carpocapsae TaxID=34508 RepID=A0A4U5PDT1_STECR|nr:hypothetical protein L596_008600 [Steinernema carpocapsae]
MKLEGEPKVDREEAGRRGHLWIFREVSDCLNLLSSHYSPKPKTSRSSSVIRTVTGRLTSAAQKSNSPTTLLERSSFSPLDAPSPPG